MTDPLPSPASVLADLEEFQAELRETHKMGYWADHFACILPRLQALFAQQETEKQQAEKEAHRWMIDFGMKCKSLEAADARAAHLQHELDVANGHRGFELNDLHNALARATHAEAQLAELHVQFQNSGYGYAADRLIDLKGQLHAAEAERDALRTQLLAYTQPHA